MLDFDVVKYSYFISALLYNLNYCALHLAESAFDYIGFTLTD